MEEAGLIHFLESFEHTGIYVVDKDSMEVYYENKIAQKYTVVNRIGKPCYLVHGNTSMCASCPLKNKNWTSHVIREDLGMVFVVQAIRTKWKDRDVYAIFVRKQEDIHNPGVVDESMTRRMNRALHTSVLTYCEINMKTCMSRAIFFSRQEQNHMKEEEYQQHLALMCEQYVHPDDRKRVEEQLGLERLQALSADSNGPTELRLRYRSKGTRGHASITLESKIYVLRNELPHYISIITKEVTAEENANMSLRLYREASKGAVSIFQINITQNRYTISERSPNLRLGVDRELAAAETFEDLCRYIVENVPEDEKESARRYFNRDNMIAAYENGKRTLRKSFPIYMDDDTYRWLMVRLDMVKNPLTRDIEGMLHSEEIEEDILKDNLITQVINNDYDYIILIDIQNNTARAYTNYGRYKPLFTSDAGNYIEDYIRRAYVGDNLEDFVLKNQIRYVQKMLKQQEKYEMYYYIREKNGEIRYKRGTYSYPNGDERYLIFSRVDNTEAIEEQKRINKQLTQALAESAKATAAKTDIFARMSHDLRTPMNAIVGMANLGLEDAKDETSRHYFEEINTSGHYLLGLINDILDMNRLEYGQVMLHEEPISCRKFIEEVLTIMQPLIWQRQIHLEKDFAVMRVPYVFCDIIRTRQIFINFLSNAIKFSAPGSTVTWKCKELEIKNGRIYYEMDFIDHGCGMSSEFMERVFEPFEQERNIYSDENSSTGLGLAITKNLVHVMGGEIAVESELGQGTTFTLHLNHRIAEEKDVSNGIVEEDFGCLKGKRVLVAEDHPLNSEIEEKLLGKQGIEVTLVKNGREALDMFSKSQIHFYDAILMDVRMPVMDGLEATREIRKLDRADAVTIPVIAVTANAFEEDKQASRRAGMTAHLSKPIVPRELYEALVLNCRNE